LRQYVREAGRDPAIFPIRGSMVAGDGGAEAWVDTARAYQAAGVTHITISAPPGLPVARSLARVIEARAVMRAALG
jgi:hypothetical protein